MADTRMAVESLESRTLLSGNVTVSVAGGDLMIAGDGAKNRITVDAAGLGAGEVRVRAADDSTTVNGDFEAIVSGVTRTIRIHMGGGSDQVTIQDLTVAGDLRLDGGRSGDTVTLNRVRVRGHTSLLGRAGDDAVVVLQSRFDRAADVRGADGADRINLDRSRFAGATVIEGGAGDDAFALDTADFARGHSLDEGGTDRVLESVEADFEFASRTLGWKSGFSDYPVGRDADWELDSGLRTPPAELNWAGKAILLSGNNHSDDLFMFLKRQVGPEAGLKPNTTYEVRFAIVFGSNAPTGGAGIGGSPGDSVFLKAGATTTEPQRFENDAGDWRMNVDKADQGTGGKDVSLAGTIANGVPAAEAGDTPKYKAVERTHVHTSRVTTDAQGRVWVIVGTDSGFEGTTSLYVRSVGLRFLPV